MEQRPKTYLTREQALMKAKQYCAYQERSHYEVIQKLWDLGIRKAEHDEIIAALIEEDYLNEERFAIQFAGGKFRMKDWGKKKIYYGLKEKQVSDYCISKALKSIPQQDYMKTLYTLAEKKDAALKGEQYMVRKKKSMDYLMQKGYEPDLVVKVMKEVAE